MQTVSNSITINSLLNYNPRVRVRVRGELIIIIIIKSERHDVIV